MLATEQLSWTKYIDLEEVESSLLYILEKHSWKWEKTHYYLWATVKTVYTEIQGFISLSASILFCIWYLNICYFFKQECLWLISWIHIHVHISYIWTWKGWGGKAVMMNFMILFWSLSPRTEGNHNTWQLCHNHKLKKYFHICNSKNNCYFCMRARACVVHTCAKPHLGLNTKTDWSADCRL